MINNLMYIELKTGYSDDGPAWIGYVKTSKSKKTIYFNDHAFQKNIGNYANYIDIENGDKYWISGLKKEESKPFSLSVLRARVNTQLRKQTSSHKNAPIHIDLFHFDFEAMTFYVGDSKVELSKTEQKLLRLLVENRGRTMTRGDLVDRIWTDGAEYVDENALSVTIKRLRDKLGAQKYIKTVYGIGYSWVTKDE